MLSFPMRTSVAHFPRSRPHVHDSNYAQEDIYESLVDYADLQSVGPQTMKRLGKASFQSAKNKPADKLMQARAHLASTLKVVARQKLAGSDTAAVDGLAKYWERECKKFEKLIGFSGEVPTSALGGKLRSRACSGGGQGAPPPVPGRPSLASKSAGNGTNPFDDGFVMDGIVHEEDTYLDVATATASFNPPQPSKGRSLCEVDCGFSGSREAVAAHESTCAKKFAASTTNAPSASSAKSVEPASAAVILGYDIEAVAELLTKMNMSAYIDAFQANQIDGELLMQIDEDMLKEDLGVASKLHRLRLMKLQTIP
jgi:hypothetical protein